MTCPPRARVNARVNGRVVARIVALVAVAVAWGVIAGSVKAAPGAQVEGLVAEILREVAEVRDLPTKGDPPVAILPRAALVDRLTRGLNSERSVREFLTSQMLLEVLGVTRRGFDLRELQLRIVAENTLAAYDYQDRTVLIAADAVRDGDLDVGGRLALAYELTHVLQDQHFQVRRIVPAPPDTGDAAMATRALVEGDAMLAMRAWGRQYLRPADKRDLGNATTPADPLLDDAPRLVQGGAMFPYDEGWAFAQRLHQDGGFAELNRAFARPPRSTEQVLHPEKYAADEQPVSVSIAPLEQSLGGSWRTLRTGVFGELALRLLLEPSVGRPTAVGAAAGWGGDGYTILEDGSGRRIVALMTVWDGDNEAAELFNAFADSVPSQYPIENRRLLEQAGIGRWAIPDGLVQVLTTGNTVRIVYAPDAATLDLVDAVISSARIGPTGPVAPPPTQPPAPPVPEGPRATATPRPSEEPAADDADELDTEPEPTPGRPNGR